MLLVYNQFILILILILIIILILILILYLFLIMLDEYSFIQSNLIIFINQYLQK